MNRSFRQRTLAVVGGVCASAVAVALVLRGQNAVTHILRAAEVNSHHWRVHDRARPQPAVVTPGTFSTQEQAGKAPSDAIVLFDGTNLDAWKSDKGGGEAKWKVENGYVEVVAKSGGLSTKESFGDCQLHVEWMSPEPPSGKDQDRGNSGIFLMGRYELQVLDSYQSETYADGMAGAMYGQYPPQVNAALPPGKWQVYDVIFHGPVFETSGQVRKPARMTVFLNGVLVQDNVELMGQTSHLKLAGYKRHAEKLPIGLQDHAHPVRFRNMWVRPISKGHPEAPDQAGIKN